MGDFFEGKKGTKIANRRNQPDNQYAAVPTSFCLMSHYTTTSIESNLFMGRRSKLNLTNALVDDTWEEEKLVPIERSSDPIV